MGFLSKHKTPLCCSHSCSNKYQAQIRKQTIDPETGLSLSALYAHKASLKNKQNGYYQSAAHKKTAAQNLSKIRLRPDVQKKMQRSFLNRRTKGLDGLSPAQKSTQKSMQTKVIRGIITPTEHKTEFERYEYLVQQCTSQNNLSELRHFDKRGLAKSGMDNYHLDHIYSIFDGFNNHVPPEIIGHINNLRFIPWYENISKNNKSGCTLEELFVKTGYEYYKYYAKDYEEIQKSKCSATKMNMVKSVCKFCGIITNIGNHNRWHGQNCKMWSKEPVSKLT